MTSETQAPPTPRARIDARRGRPTTPRQEKAVKSSGFRPDIQGLRAVAVGAVLLYHANWSLFGGGFVGVDVFFVISGFLITGILLREAQSTGRIRLGDFYAKRARRILPAATIVLLTTLVLTVIFLPQIRWESIGVEALASAAYVVNWVFAAGTDYLNAEVAASPLQHFWTLAVEEQFYIVWPLVLVAALALAHRAGRRDDTADGRARGMRAIRIGILLVLIPSLLFSIYYTAAEPEVAYFVTTTRLWELAIGAALAVFAPQVARIPHWLGYTLGWAGLAAIVAATLWFSDSMPFPGSAALVPTLGAAAIIAAGMNGRAERGVGRLLTIRPMRFIGDISYSLYLWHWPLIVIAPSVPFWGLTIYHRLALLALCFALAWLTKRFVEDPARGWKVLTSRPARVTLWSSLAAMVVVALVAATAWFVNAPAYAAGARAIQQLQEDPPPCFGAAAVLDPACADADFGDDILPAPGFAGIDRPGDEQCFVQLTDARPVSCEFGSDDPDAPRVALVGDSHAFQLLSTFQRMAEDNGWRLVTWFKGACPWNTTPLSTPGAFGAACTEWRDGVRDAMADAELDAVFTAAIATTPYASTGYDSAHDAAVAGYRDAWGEVLDRGIPVITVADNPVWETDPNKCLRTRDVAECDAARSAVLVADDPLRDAAAGLDGVTLLDFTDVFCDDAVCAPVVGGANIYRDQDHLTVTFADTLAPWYAEAIAARLAERAEAGGAGE